MDEKIAISQYSLSASVACGKVRSPPAPQRDRQILADSFPSVCLANSSAAPSKTCSTCYKRIFCSPSLSSLSLPRSKPRNLSLNIPQRFTKLLYTSSTLVSVNRSPLSLLVCALARLFSVSFLTFLVLKFRCNNAFPLDLVVQVARRCTVDVWREAKDSI